MAGLAALLSFGSDRTTTQTLRALSDALAPRGDDEAMAEHGASRLLVRAALPKIYEGDGVALIVDGIAEVTSLLARFAMHGPSGLLSGAQPYAVILSDPDGLVLVRNHDGPPLYYARSRGAVLVASEPAALLAAGIPAVPNEAVMARFLNTGACDEVPATFFDGIRRVLPGQVVEVSRHTDASGQSDGWAVRAHPPAPSRSGRLSARMALLGALGDERTGVVLLGAGQSDIALPTAALFGAALAERESHRGVPVYSAALPGTGKSVPSFTSAVLGPIPDGAVRHRALPFYTDEIDVDGFVADLGEPVPGLSGYLLWAMARATGGEVDTLLAATGWRGPTGHLSRLSDRVAARYGVTLRFPLKDLDGTDEGLRAELQTIAERTLPHASLRAAAAHSAGLDPALADVLQRLRAELATALLYPRTGEQDQVALAGLSHLGRASGPELERLWRRYVLDRWLNIVAHPEKAPIVPAPQPEIVAIGQWHRRLVGTEQLEPGDRVAEKLAWYVAESLDAMGKPARQAMRQPWYLIVAAKSVAVAQGRAKAVWEIQPGKLARFLARGAHGTRHPDPWSLQVAIDEGGGLRMSAALLCARLGRRTWYERVSGLAARSVSPPREHSCPPGHLSVTAPPREPELAAAEIIEALRRALPDEFYDQLAGCAIVGVDADGVRQLGWSGPAEAPVALLQKLCADNPFGQGDERTPLLIALAAAKQTGPPTARKGGRRQPAKRR